MAVDYEEYWVPASEAEVMCIMGYMVAAWPRQEIPVQTVAVYVVQMLRSGLAADVLLLAAMALVDVSTFFPSVAEWRAKAEEIQAHRQMWLVSENYLNYGEEWPLRLPPVMKKTVFEHGRFLESGR